MVLLNKQVNGQLFVNKKRGYKTVNFYIDDTCKFIFRNIPVYENMETPFIEYLRYKSSVPLTQI